jgi:hypothetical protein
LPVVVDDQDPPAPTVAFDLKGEAEDERGALRRELARGSRTVNSLPLPTPSLAALTEPPWSSTTFLTIASPSPRFFM